MFLSPMNEKLIDLFHQILFESEKCDILKYKNDNLICNTIEYKYLCNLCNLTSHLLDITGVENMCTKICMILSSKDNLISNNDIFIDHDLIGVYPLNYNFPILYVKITNTQNVKFYQFTTKKYKFDFPVSKLSLNEQVCLIFHMIKTYKTETNLITRNLKVNAYLDRLSFDKNDKHYLITRILVYYNSLVNDKYKDLENIINTKYKFNNFELLNYPLIPQKDLEIQLANVYYKYGYYKKSLELYKRHNFSKEEIECLTCLRRKDEAIEKIKYEIDKLRNKQTFDEKVLYCHYCIKLGWLENNILWFDKGYKKYPSFEALEQKAIFFYKKGDYKNAKICYEEVLKIVPKNERILFAYASVKILLEEYFECIDIFKRLLENDRKHPEYLRNLSLCYFKTNDIKNCMCNLKSNALLDNKSMDMYFKLVVKYKEKKEILWCLKKMENIKNRDIYIEHLISRNILTKEDL